jgi:transposase
LSLKLGVSAGSIQKWKKTYLDGGLDALLEHGRKGSVSKIFCEEERKFLSETLSNPRNGIQGYRELRKIMSAHFGREFSYPTLVGYCKRNFGSRIKVARKSHVKKDENAVSDLKKTLMISSSRLLQA